MKKLLTGPEGTPKTFNEALEQISKHLDLDWKAEERRIARMHLRDFMAQKFVVAMVKNEKSEKVLKNLFEQLFF